MKNDYPITLLCAVMAVGLESLKIHGECAPVRVTISITRP